MTIFIDDGYKRTAAYWKRHGVGQMKMSHMMSDSDADELHKLAARIGMKREWFQKDHYDVPIFRRAMAIQHGAVECTSRDLVRIRQTKATQKVCKICSGDCGQCGGPC